MVHELETVIQPLDPMETFGEGMWRSRSCKRQRPYRRVPHRAPPSLAQRRLLCLQKHKILTARLALGPSSHAETDCSLSLRSANPLPHHPRGFRCVAPAALSPPDSAGSPSRFHGPRPPRRLPPCARPRFDLDHDAAPAAFVNEQLRADTVSFPIVQFQAPKREALEAVSKFI